MWRAAAILRAGAPDMIDADQKPDASPRGRTLWTEIPRDRNVVDGRAFREGDAVWSVLAITRAHLDRFGLTADALPPELAEGWLSFETGTERRRYFPIPDGWETMLPHELRELCHRASPVAPPGPTPDMPSPR